MKVLLGQLANNGDCLYSTILARQIKHDYPDAHVTWAISSKCKNIPINNPYVDDVWVFPLIEASQIPQLADNFVLQALKYRDRGDFDRVIYSQIWPHNFQNYDGTVRPSILRAYGAEITVPIENVLCLTDAELNNVANYVVKENLLDFDHRIIFECSSSSGQSFASPELAQEIAMLVYEKLPSACVILSTHVATGLRHGNTKLANNLSLREIAALTKVGTLFVGSGSGCTVAATSTAATQLPMIQLLVKDSSVFASFAHDFDYYGKPSEHIVEMTETTPERIAEAIITACTAGIAETRERFHETIDVNFGFYQTLVVEHLLVKNRFVDAARSAMLIARRYGWVPEIFAYSVNYVVPNLMKDSQWFTPDGRRDSDMFIESLNEAARNQPNSTR
jgi:hypothetical protein